MRFPHGPTPPSTFGGVPDEPGDESFRTAVPSRGVSIITRLGLTGWDAAALSVAVLSIVAYAPPFFLDGWTPRMALLLAFGCPGLVVLGRLVIARNVAAALLTTAIVWAWVVALMSGAIRSSSLGFVGRDLSALTLSLSAGLWAVGTRVSDRGRRLLPEAIVYASATCALVGVLQVVASVDAGPLALVSGRPTSFLTNPVYFGAITSMGLVAALALWDDVHWGRLTVSMLVLGSAVSLSGSRVALAASVLVVVMVVAVDRRRSKLYGAAVAIGSLLLGVVLDRLVGAGGNAASRLSQTSSSAGGRSQVWQYGLEAWGERPLVGHGLGRFRPAVQDRFSVEFVRDFAADDVTQAWFDAHNVVVGLLVGVGIVGTLLIAGWAIVWGKTIRGPLAWALAPVCLHWMLQPVSLYTLPLALLVFGAARHRTMNVEASKRRSERLPLSIAGLVGVALAFSLLVSDLYLDWAVGRLDGDAAASVAVVFMDDSVIGDVTARIYAASDGTSSDDSLNWRRRVAVAEADRPYWWTSLAQAEAAAGDLNAAKAAIERSLKLQPYNVRASVAAASIYRQLGDEAEFTVHMDLLCSFGFDEACDLENRAGLDR